MSALLVGVLVVMVSSLGFGAAMFGRRPIPQVAMEYAGSPADAVMAPRRRAATAGAAGRAVTAVAEDEGERPKPHIHIPASVRIRSMLVLAVGVVGMAALVGVVMSVIVVGFFTLLN